MFKNLRDRLKDVSNKLEDELEAQLEAELERELAESMGQTAPKDESAEAAEPPEDKPDADGEPVGETDEPPEGEDSDEEEPPARPDQEPAKESSEAGAPEQDEAPNPPQATTAAHAEPETPKPASAPPKSDVPKLDVPKAKQAITGRKQFTDEELAQRVARELQEAVEVQKEVETVARQSATITRFTINEQVLDDILWELEIGLLESDVALPVIEAIKENVRDQLLSTSVGGKSAADVVEKVLRAAVKRVLRIGAFDFDEFIKERIDTGKVPIVVMFVGVNGTGKTTSIARLAWRLKQQGISCVMAAGDTFRAGAIEQLSQHGDKLGIKVVKHSAGADPAAVAFDAIEHAKARNKSVVLLDTAGRMQTNSNLMDEMDKIRRVANPALTVFVGDSLAGNDAVEQARHFDKVVDVQGAILTKTDVDAKGGAALSVAYTINKPLLFIGVGQDYEDLEPFDAEKMVERLFGSGDT